MTTVNLYRRLLEILPADLTLVGEVIQGHSDGTATVELPGGGRLRARDPLVSEVGAKVFVQSGAITGPAPDLPFVNLEI